MKYLIVILLPELISSKITRIQTKYQSSRWKITLPPHITLIPPTTFKLNEMDLLSELSNTKTPRPFVLRIKGIDYFENQFVTIYSLVEKSPGLMKLQTKIEEKVQQINNCKIPRSDFVPHITLSNRLGKSEASGVIKQLGGYAINYNFICNRYSLMRKDVSDPAWNKVADIELKNS